MKIKAFVIIDTNVLVSAMYSTSNPPYEILKMVDKGNIIPIYDKRIIKEYYDVFRYDKFKENFTEEMLRTTLENVISKGILVTNVEKTKQEMTDNEDIPFFEVKESAKEFDPMIVTGNLKHFPEDQYIVSPRELITVLSQLERFVLRDLDYDKLIREFIAKNLESDKYLEGASLIDKMFEDESGLEIKEDFFEEIDI